jgi:hypothetical protein
MKWDFVHPEHARWEPWRKGEGRCPYCQGETKEDFAAMCDCWQYEREYPDDTEFWR